MMMKFFSFCGGLLLPLAFVNAAPVAYSGKVAVNGANFEGEARFKFSFTDANGTVLWSHSSDANASLPVDVARGHYFVLLGENMNPIPDNLFIDHPAVYLRVHFRSTAEGPFLHLLPDQRIASAPHALSADIATSVKLGSVTRNHLAPEVLADLNRTLSPGSVTREMLSASVRADLNSSVSNASVTAENLDPNLVRYFLPEISTQPVGTLVLQGTGSALSSSATGKFLTYQWRKNGVDIAGENNASIIFPDANASSHDGNYTVVVSNDWGSVVSSVANFTVATSAPVINIEGNSSVTHEGGIPYVDPGANATDALDRNITASVIVTGSVDVNQTGNNQLIYNVTDSGGNPAAEKVRTVTVVDTTPPVLNLIGDANQSHPLGTAWQDPGCSATDSLDGNLSGQVSVTGSVDVNQSGTYLLTYAVSDGEGNAAITVSRTVNVAPSGPWNFSSAGASGRLGPTQAQIDANYSGTTLENKITIQTRGIQKWVVPMTGTYRIEAWGAQGGSTGGGFIGGKGSRIRGDINLTQGETLQILVGHKGVDSTNDPNYGSAGGGGGSFVAKGSQLSSSIPLLIAGGGGGAKKYGNDATRSGNGGEGQIGQSGQNSAYNGGASGNGGSRNTSGAGGFAGGGFSSDGGPHSNNIGKSGFAFVNGGEGGLQQDNSSNASEDGGFGGGGGGMHNNNQGGGGGGGYSGGGAGHDHGPNQKGWGGGGGSFNTGSNQSNAAGVNSGHGKVIISLVTN